MTYSTFAKMAAAALPGVEVGTHGADGRGVWVKFPNSPRCYDYSGSYGDILQKLGAPVALTADAAAVAGELEQLRRMNGTRSAFVGRVLDCSKRIAAKSEELQKLLAAPVREWDYDGHGLPAWILYA